MAEVVCLKKPEAKPSTVQVDEAFFGDMVRKRLLRDVVLMYEANVRQGTHSTKTRSEVAFSKRKPWRQKGTGRARSGKASSPLWRKGGVIFGPRPRDYSYSMPRRAKREALRSAILGKLLDGEVRFVDDLALDTPSTKAAAALLARLDCLESASVVLPEEDETAFKSFRNLPRVDVVTARDLTAYYLLARGAAVFIGDAFERVKERLGDWRAIRSHARSGDCAADAARTSDAVADQQDGEGGDQ